MLRARPPILLVAAAVAVFVAACGGDDTSSSSTGPASTTGETSTSVPASTVADDGTIRTADYLAFRDQTTACGAEAPPPATAMQFEAPEDLGLSDVVRAVLVTSCGNVELELYPSVAPETVNSFVFLAEQGYFDGTVIHRVAEDFVVQAGDPTATGAGNPGYFLPDELPPDNFTYVAGTVAMANSGAPDSGGSQFFLIIEDSPLPPDYAAFGLVTAGLDVTGLMEEVPKGPNQGLGGELSRPLETIYLERVEIER